MMKMFTGKGLYRYLLLLLLIFCSSKMFAQQRMGDNLGNHTASSDLKMNSKKILNASNIAIGTTALVNGSVALQVDGLDKAVLFPRVTTLSGVITPVNGMMVYNTADDKFYVRQGGVWVNFVSQESSGIAKYTTVQRDALVNPSADMLIFNTDTRVFQVYDASIPGWVPVGTVNTAGLPVVSTAISAAVSTKPDTAFAGGTVVSEGVAAVTTRGVCWNTATGPTVANFSSVNGSGSGDFTSTLWGLLPATKYFIRAFAVNIAGTVYGNELVITTGAASAPVVSATAPVTDMTSATATSGGTVATDKGAAVTSRGVCWAITGFPTIANTKTSNGTGTGSFTSAITGLNSNITYFLRAYATNSSGTSYGPQVSFTTPTDLPSVTGAAITKSGTAASSGGNVTKDGGAAVTARGVVWSATTTLPTAEVSSKTVNGSGTGSFTSALTGLIQNTAYYARAYATNSEGTGYGAIFTFTSNGVPVLDETVLNSVTANSASLGGVVQSDGGSTVIARGFVYNTTGTPTTASTVVNSGTGTGNFTSTINGLNSATTYYVRSFGTNAIGTAYGPQMMFTTSGSINFNFTGSQQVFIVPAGVTSLSLSVNGATGGGSASKGGLATGLLAVTPGQQLFIYVGGASVNGNSTFSAGGFNGGGTGTGINSGGGGASDIRVGGTALSNRVIVAGGGGGSAIVGGTTIGIGGNGGGALGADGNSTAGADRTGKGGTQAAGGISAATGGNAGTSGTGGQGSGINGSGAGGGGYFGGGGGANGGGGGGSGYIGGVTSGGLTSGVNISTSDGRIQISW
jgi:hypothetical protein